MLEVTLHAIGVIHSPFQDLAGMPIQPSGESSAPGTIEIFPEYQQGLKDLDIKPYVPEFDYPPQARIGWLEQARDKARKIKSDGRFGG